MLHSSSYCKTDTSQDNISDNCIREMHPSYVIIVLQNVWCMLYYIYHIFVAILVIVHWVSWFYVLVAILGDAVISVVACWRHST